MDGDSLGWLEGSEEGAEDGKLDGAEDVSEDGTEEGAEVGHVFSMFAVESHPMPMIVELSLRQWEVQQPLM